MVASTTREGCNHWVKKKRMRTKAINADLIQLVSGDSEAVVSKIGSALVSLTLRAHAVMPTPKTPRNYYHGVLLAPWPNRIAGGEYEFQGRQYLAEKNDDFGNALHGLLLASESAIESVSTDSVTLVSEIKAGASYPWDLTVRVFFSLTEDKLRVQITATNNSDSDAPVGLGTHPYFVFDEDSTLEVRAARAFVHGADMMPISEIDSADIGFGRGRERPIERQSLDVQFTEVEPSCAILRTRDWTMEIFQERADFLMVYTTQDFNWADGRTRAVAIEPQTAAADAFNNGRGLWTLPPKASESYLWGVRDLTP